jgi:hypothetical protein
MWWWSWCGDDEIPSACGLLHLVLTQKHLPRSSYCISVSAMSHSKNAPIEASPMTKTHQPAPSVRNHVSAMIRPNKHVTWGKPHQHMWESPPGILGESRHSRCPNNSWWHLVTWWCWCLRSGYFSHSHGSPGPFIDCLPIKTRWYPPKISCWSSPRRMIQEAREPRWAQDSAGARFQVPCPILGWQWDVPWMTLWLRNRTLKKCYGIDGPLSLIYDDVSL